MEPTFFIFVCHYYEKLFIKQKEREKQKGRKKQLKAESYQKDIGEI